MKKIYLIDTVILVDHLNGIEKATEWIESDGCGRSVISVITRAEVLTGTPRDAQERVRLLLASFDCLRIDEDDANNAAELRREFRWKLPDAFQAALAKRNDLRLVTRNTNDFNPDKHGFVLAPYSL